MTKPFQSSSLLLAVASCFVPAISVAAEPPRPADCVATELLPKTVIAFAEVPDLGGTLKTILNHPLRSELEAIPAYDAVLQSGALGQLQAVMGGFEATMQNPWHHAITTISDRGAVIALDASKGGVVILLHSSDADALERFRGFVLSARQMQGEPAKQGEYRGFIADSIGKDLKMVRMNDWLLVTSKSELGKSVVDQYLDRDQETLASKEAFINATKELKVDGTDDRVASAFLDIAAIRDAGIARDVFDEKLDNFAIEVLLGGVLANLGRAPYATAHVDLNNDELALRASIPHNRQWESPREYYFGSPELADAPPLLNTEDRLFALSAHRDLSQMWLRAGDLMSERVNDQLAMADTQLTTFFSGLDFGEDVLGSLESDVQIVGKSQDFSEVLPQPAIKLPEFAFQFRMKTPEETAPQFRRVFQSLIGFLNIVGASEGQPPLDMGMERVGEAQMITAKYLPVRGEEESLDAKIQFNFSPTLAFAGDRMIIASATPLAREMVTPAESPQEQSDVPSNTSLRFEISALKKILQANRSQLVANSMLEKGHSKAAAEGEIDMLLGLVGFLRTFQLDLDVTETKMILDASVDFSPPSEPQS